MNDNPNTSKIYFRTLSILNRALIMGQIIFLCTVIAIRYFEIHQSDEDPFLTNVLLIVSFSMLIFTFIFNRFVLSKKLDAILPAQPLKEKLHYYRAISINKWAKIEGFGFLGIIAFLVTNEVVFLGFSLISLVWLFIDGPSKNKALAALPLSTQESSLLRNPDGIIE